MAGKQITISERFHLEQVPQKDEQLKIFVKENPDYALSSEELLDTDHEGERVYQLSVPVFSVELTGLDVSKKKAGRSALKTQVDVRKVSGESEEAAAQAEETAAEAPDEKRESETVPDSADTEARIGVLANGTRIGWIRDEDRLHMINLYRNYKITGLELDVHGGPYRIVRQDADGGISEDSGDARWSAVLTVYRRVPKSGMVSIPETLTPEQMAASAAFAGMFAGKQMPYGSRMNAGQWEPQGYAGSRSAAPAPEPEPSDEKDAEDSWGIDTTYETVRKEKDPSGRGMVFLLLAAIIATCYLCFSVPGWIPSLGNGASVIEPMGYRITGLPGYVPGAVFGLGLLFNIVGMFRGGSILSLSAAFCYLLSGFTAPDKILFTSIPAVLCILGAICKKKGSAALKWLLALILAAAAAFLLYQHFSGKSFFDPFRGRELTDWRSAADFFSGKTSDNTGSGDDFEYETDPDGTVYYASEDESDWESDESEFWSGDEVFFEGESEYLMWEQMEGETGAMFWEYTETETETESETGEGRLILKR